MLGALLMGAGFELHMRRPCLRVMRMLTFNRKVRHVRRILREDGWYVVRVRGSHQQWTHPTKPGLVTIAGKPSDDLTRGTLNSILKQARLKP